jgi:hypothetical protein
MSFVNAIGVHLLIQLIALVTVFIWGDFWLVWQFRERGVSTANVNFKSNNENTDELAIDVTEQSHGDPARSQLRHDFGNTSWCRNSTCNNSLLCQSCKRRYLIIFTSGRSASTTLTWMMDSLPGIRMSGENNDLLRKFFTFFQSTFDENFLSGIGRKTAWGRNNIEEGSLSCILQNTIELITPPELPIHNMEEEQSMIIGFKTIRSHKAKDTEEMQVFVEFLKKNLPCARYFINFRSDFEDHMQSVQTSLNWNVSGVKMELGQLKLLYELLGSEHAYLLDSTQWTKDVGVLNQALDWLGYSSSCYFSELLEFNTKKYDHTKTFFSNSSAFANCTRH